MTDADFGLSRRIALHMVEAFLRNGFSQIVGVSVGLDFLAFACVQKPMVEAFVTDMAERHSKFPIHEMAGPRVPQRPNSSATLDLGQKFFAATMEDLGVEMSQAAVVVLSMLGYCVAHTPGRTDTIASLMRDYDTIFAYRSGERLSGHRAPAKC